MNDEEDLVPSSLRGYRVVQPDILRSCPLVHRLGSSRDGKCSDGALGVWVLVAWLGVVRNTHQVSSFIRDLNMAHLGGALLFGQMAFPGRSHSLEEFFPMLF